jgi:hypothetical protein
MRPASGGLASGGLAAAAAQAYSAVLTCSMPCVHIGTERRATAYLDVGTCKPYGLGTRKQRGCVMRRRRSISHTIEDRIAVEKARLEALVPNVPPGPARDALLKNQTIGNRLPR